MKKVFLVLLPLILAVIVFLVLIFLFKFSPSGKGSLQVTSVPKASVYLDGKPIGQTPLCRCEIKTMFPSGDYTIKLIPQGDSRPFEQKITINKSTLTALDITFNGLTYEGSVVSLFALSDKKASELLLVSFPQKADVFLDNNLEGTTPVLIKNITESDHDLRVSKDGYKDKLIKISTHLGYKLSAVVYLDVNPAILNPSENISATQPASLSVQKVLIQSPLGYVNVRETGSLNGVLIEKVYTGDTLELIEEKDGWFEIKLKNGKTGWINSSYADKL